jgi:hypothetical protein
MATIASTIRRTGRPAHSLSCWTATADGPLVHGENHLLGGDNSPADIGRPSPLICFTHLAVHMESVEDPSIVIPGRYRSTR